MSESYFSVDALSSTAIKELLKSPAHYLNWLNSPKEDTAAPRVGRALHQKVLEPEKNDIVIFSDTKTFLSKAGAQFLADNKGSICLTVEEAFTVDQMAQSILRSTTLLKLIDSCEKEKQIFLKEGTAYGEVNTKAMLDAVNSRVILDIKTTGDDACDFPFTARRYKYDVQAAWYQKLALQHDGIFRDFYFVVVEKNAPYGAMIWQAGSEMLDRGLDKCLRAVELYAACKNSNLWPSYDTNAINILH